MNEPVHHHKLVILGNPEAQKRHRTYTKGRHGKPLPFPRQVDPSAQSKVSFREIVQRQAPQVPYDCPLRVDLWLFFPRPKSHFRTGKYAGILKDNAPEWHSKRPDRDNCDKLILDSMTGVFWTDDSRICDGRIVKRYSDKPRTEIYIKVLQ